jgi:hypothetical protein
MLRVARSLFLPLYFELIPERPIQEFGHCDAFVTKQLRSAVYRFSVPSGLKKAPALSATYMVIVFAGERAREPVRKAMRLY